MYKSPSYLCFLKPGRINALQGAAYSWLGLLGLREHAGRWRNGTALQYLDPLDPRTMILFSRPARLSARPDAPCSGRRAAGALPSVCPLDTSAAADGG